MSGVMPPALRASLALLGAAAVVAGCGGGAPDPVTDRDAVLRLRLGDPEYAMDPGAIKVRAGRIRIVATNRGVLTHNVKVEEDTEEEAAVPLVYGGTETMQPGETAPIAEVRLATGRYRLVCTIGNHENLGQYAELEVTKAGP